MNIGLMVFASSIQNYPVGSPKSTPKEAELRGKPKQGSTGAPNRQLRTHTRADRKFQAWGKCFRCFLWAAWGESGFGMPGLVGGILGLSKDNIGVVSWLYRDNGESNGKSNGNYYYWGDIRSSHNAHVWSHYVAYRGYSHVP